MANGRKSDLLFKMFRPKVGRLQEPWSPLIDGTENIMPETTSQTSLQLLPQKTIHHRQSPYVIKLPVQ